MSAICAGESREREETAEEGSSRPAAAAGSSARMPGMTPVYN